MSWLRLPLEYVCTLLRAIPWRVRVLRVHRLQASDYSIGSPTSGTPQLKLGPTHVHHLKAANYDLDERSFPGDGPEMARARKRLVRLMRNNPDPRALKPEHRSKDAIRKIYRARFRPLSKRAFNGVWDFAISKTGATAYREPGPRN
jgi:hypothetical protein